MRRLLLKLALFLLLLCGGAIANVAVAWGCSIFSNGREQIEIDLNAEQSTWPIPVPVGTPPPNELLIINGFGVQQSLYSLVVFEQGLSAERSRQWPSIDVPDLRMQDVHAAGFPALCLHYANTYSIDARHQWVFGGWPLPTLFERQAMDPSERIPSELIWPGFAINTIFYSALLWVSFFVPGKIRRLVRIRRGRCPACGYHIAPGVGNICSECGHTLPQH